MPDWLPTTDPDANEATSLSSHIFSRTLLGKSEVSHLQLLQPRGSAQTLMKVPARDPVERLRQGCQTGYLHQQPQIRLQRPDLS